MDFHLLATALVHAHILVWISGFYELHRHLFTIKHPTWLLPSFFCIIYLPIATAAHRLESLFPFRPLCVVWSWLKSSFNTFPARSLSEVANVQKIEPISVQKKVERKVLVRVLSHLLVGVSGCRRCGKGSVTLNGTGPLCRCVRASSCQRRRSDECLSFERPWSGVLSAGGASRGSFAWLGASTSPQRQQTGLFFHYVWASASLSWWSSSW